MAGFVIYPSCRDTHANEHRMEIVTDIIIDEPCVYIQTYTCVCVFVSVCVCVCACTRIYYF